MFKKILVLLLLSVISTYAVEESNIKKVMDDKVKKVLHVLKDTTLSQKSFRRCFSAEE